MLTDAGRDFARGFLQAEPGERSRAPLCRECLDWSERRSHLAGHLGRAMLARLTGLGWARRDPDSRVIRFSPEGERQFRAMFSG
ncbi:MAG: hypothetical protein U1E55_12295 [Paracoccus sp. (in: a-proteobacteria)]